MFDNLIFNFLYFIILRLRQVRNAIAQRGLILVGWYHSHPSYQPDPSVQDIHNQLKYQSILQQENAPYGPCLGIIVCKYFRDFIPRINDNWSGG